MKKLLHFFILLCMTTGIANSCKESGLDRSLSQAGNNRKELEAVLRHYRNAPLKLQAARFLIENMDAHYGFGGEAVEEYYHAMDSIFRHGKGDRTYWNRQYDSILAQVGTGLDSCMSVPLFDIEHIKADFLIAHIDSAFAVWDRNWNRQYSFDMFLRYVLPYRIGHEGLSLWRGNLSMAALEQESYKQNIFNSTYVYEIANTISWLLRPAIYYPSRHLPNFPLDKLPNLKLASCREYAHLCAALFRARGIPATVDFVPQWGNRSLGHVWCVFFPNNQTSIPVELCEPLGTEFMRRREDRLPKVFRNTYEKNPYSLYVQNKERDSLPSVFNTPYILDVTDQYVETSDVDVHLYNLDYDTRYVYLSVFNDQKWSIVHWARKKGTKARFTKLGRDIVYLPVYFIQGLTIPAGNAFLLDHKGLKTDIQPDISKKISVTVKRKFRDTKSNHFLQGVIGGKFQVANRKDFRDSITLYDIPRIEDNRYHKVNTNMSQPYKYFRYLSPNLSRGNMAELYVFNETGDTLRPHEYFGNLHTRPGMGIENLSDGNTLSYYESHDLYNVWYGWEFESPSQISQILFLPRNDDNFIREKEIYELLYWDNGEWHSLGQQTGNFKSELVFKNVPSGALLLLRNHTKGKEERIFTYQNGKQIWR